MAYKGPKDNELEVDQPDIEESQEDDQRLVQEGKETHCDDPTTSTPWHIHQVWDRKRYLVVIDELLCMTVNVIDGVQSNTDGNVGGRS